MLELEVLFIYLFFLQHKHSRMIIEFPLPHNHKKFEERLQIHISWLVCRPGHPWNYEIQMNVAFSFPKIFMCQLPTYVILSLIN